ncbi:uncharacterized protein LOC123631793 isoform X1 [Lemur catta]|uniref:uncharacterized protein LOC123631793 isoform X1 n=1 Tax=Lemur catta TaxID=9447 RepID=UPI001E26CCF2|nr:uncharacterized protein LOC123631793 isoform X1 [Lemur catta]
MTASVRGYGWRAECQGQRSKNGIPTVGWLVSGFREGAMGVECPLLRAKTAGRGETCRPAPGLPRGRQTPSPLQVPVRLASGTRTSPSSPPALGSRLVSLSLKALMKETLHSPSYFIVLQSPVSPAGHRPSCPFPLWQKEFEALSLHGSHISVPGLRAGQNAAHWETGRVCVCTAKRLTGEHKTGRGNWRLISPDGGQRKERVKGAEGFVHLKAGQRLARDGEGEGRRQRGGFHGKPSSLPTV